MAALGLAWSTASWAQPMDEARQLLQQGDAEAAYRLLIEAEAEHAGDVQFDYLLGTTALDAGHPSRAVLVLERVLAQRPDFAGARMALARSYFEMGEYQHARQEFLVAQQQDPPPEARRAIQQYLDAIRKRTASRRPSLSGNLRVESGYDSNANASTDSDTFLGFQLSESNVETESGYAEAGAGIRYSAPITPDMYFFTGGDVSTRSNWDAHFIDTDKAEANAGLAFPTGDSQLQADLHAYVNRVDGETNSYGGDLRAQWGRMLGDANRLTLFGRLGGRRYDQPSLEVQDVDRLLAGLSWDHDFGNGLVAGPSVFGGVEEEVEDGSPYGRTLYGARLSASMPLAANLDFAASAGWLRSDYDGRFFGSKREDDQADASLRLTWELAPSWKLTPEVSYVDRSSDLVLYEYTRTVAGITLRKELR